MTYPVKIKLKILIRFVKFNRYIEIKTNNLRRMANRKGDFDEGFIEIHAMSGDGGKSPSTGDGGKSPSNITSLMDAVRYEGIRHDIRHNDAFQTACEIGFLYSNAHHGTERHTRMIPGRLRHKKYIVFKQFSDIFDPDIYNSSHHDTGKGVCILLAAKIAAVVNEHRRERGVIQEKKKKKDKIDMKIAGDKRAEKYTMMRDRYGDDGFNRMKQRDQEASRERKAAEVSKNADKIAKFLGWRRTAQGRAYDRAMKPMAFNSISTVSGASSKTNLGGADAAVMAEMAIHAIKSSGASCIEIEFNVDKYDSATTLCQFGITENHVSLPVKGASHFDERKTFKITGYIELKGDIYVSLRDGYTDKASNLHRLLPKEWSDFENWVDHGIAGNPKKGALFNLAFKISPTNIGQIRFDLEGVQYTLRFSKVKCQSFNAICEKMVGKYERAALEAQKIADAERARRNAEAHRKGMEKANGGKKTDNDSTDALLKLFREGKITVEHLQNAFNPQGQ